MGGNLSGTTERRIKAGFSNAVIWGVVSAVGWTGLSVLIFLLARLDPESTSELPSRVIPRLAATTGAIGFVTGGAFSGFVRFLSRARSLQDLRPLETTLWGGLAGIIGYSPFLVDDLLSGAVPVQFVPASLVGAGVVGAVTSYGILRIGRSGAMAVESIEDGELLPNAKAPQAIERAGGSDAER